MNHPYYPFNGNESVLQFDFDSINSQTGKAIRKRVEFTPTRNPALYNLALGDVLPNGILDLFSRSNNDDRDVILATVAQIISAFLTEHPERLVLFTGSTAGRTRLYRLAIARELDNTIDLFDIYGVSDSQQLELFRPDSQYIAFIIRRKTDADYAPDKTKI